MAVGATWLLLVQGVVDAASGLALEVGSYMSRSSDSSVEVSSGLTLDEDEDLVQGVELVMFGWTVEEGL